MGNTTLADELEVNAIHSCHDQCTRPLCVLRRENEKLREALEPFAQAASTMATWAEDHHRLSAYPGHTQGLTAGDLRRARQANRAIRSMVPNILAALRTPAPAPVVGDVVAYRLDHKKDGPDFSTIPLTDADKAAGWTETPLYAALQAQPAQAQGDDVVERVRRSLDLSEKTIRNHHKAGNVTEPGIVAIADVLADARAALAAMQQAPFQARVGDWMGQCFTPEIVADKLERSDRFIEEALELVQACGYDATRAHALVDDVFGRPVGEPSQEVGGVMVTLAALCNPHGLDMMQAGETELARILQPEIIEKIRAKQASKPTGSALPIPMQQAPVSDAAKIAAIRAGGQP
jgi:hypothetical protein